MPTISNTSPDTPYDAIEACVIALRAEFPGLSLTFGYIGNVDRFGDDRCWRVFTNRAPKHDETRLLSWGHYSTKLLSAMLESIERGDLRKFCDDAMTCPRRY